jgi:quercetin dioxygenase-like cupin family protein
MAAKILMGAMGVAMFLTHPVVAQTPGATPAAGHVMVTPAEVRWQGTGGVSFAVVEGDPEKPGGYSVMYRLADGRWIAPHWHPHLKRVAVLSGTALMGWGESGDTSQVKALPAGSFAVVPAKTVHYEGARGETVLLFTGEGPLATHFTGRQPRRP